MCHLRVRIVDDRPLTEPGRADFWMVVPGGDGRRADPPRDRRTRRVQLRTPRDARARTGWSPRRARSRLRRGRSSAGYSRPICPGGGCSSARSWSSLRFLPSPAGWRTQRPRRERSSTWWAPRCRRSGSALIVFGILRSGAWGFIQPKPGAPEWLGLSPAIWLMLGGGSRRYGCSSAGRTVDSLTAPSRS